MSASEKNREAGYGANAWRDADARLRSFWERLSEGLQVSELWRQFQSEARAGYGLYSREVDWENLEKKKKYRRGIEIARALFWAMLMKLSPARRVALLVALGLLFVGTFQIDFSETFHVSFHWGPVGVAILFLLLALELADRVTMKRDLEIAREIQSWLMPSQPPQVEGVDIAFAARAANTVAGDYYDAFVRPAEAGGAGHGALMLAVADVAGKSVPAALLMATFQSSLHTLAAARMELIELVHGLNGYSCAHSLGGARFTTAFLAEYDRSTRTLRYVNAGHNAPVLRRVNGTVERLDSQGLPLGIRSEESYEVRSAVLERHDVLVIFTDGVVEAFNAEHEEYGDARLRDLLDIVPGESAGEILRHLFADVDRFAGGTRQSDDMTCLILRMV